MKIKIKIYNESIEFDRISSYKIEDNYGRVSFEIETISSVSEERDIFMTITFSVDRNELKGFELL